MQSPRCKLGCSTVAKSAIMLLHDLYGIQAHQHFNKVNLESVFQKRYLFAGESLGGSARFHNDLLEYIKNRGVNKDMSANRLFSLINLDLNKKLFSNLEEFSNDEKRKYWITGAFLNEYIDSKKKQTAIEYLQDLFQRYPNKNICFFCSETNPRHCHRYKTPLYHIIKSESQ